MHAIVKFAHRAAELGWMADRVLVIDDDQGQSGATSEGRLGFQRLRPTFMAVMLWRMNDPPD
jgi:hypothetical protein